jgi:hypothetical protein
MSIFYDVITAAVSDIVTHGFDSQKRVDDWMKKIRQAALESLVPEREVEEAVKKTMKNLYQRMVVKHNILEYHPGLSKFTVDMVKPKLRNELDRAIMANASLIKLNREAAVETCVRRFAGWSTSIPVGGTEASKKQVIKSTIRKSLAQLPFEERRVAIDQGHKFVSSLNRIIAVDKGALGAIWHSHWRQPGYRYRPDHKERDLHFYVVRDNWAIKQGLMRVGPDGYTDQITQPAEECFCRCTYQYVYNLLSIPEHLLTEKGRKALERALIS